MEWQDWLEGEALPAARDFAQREFVAKGPGHWFSEASYNAMCLATGHDPTSHIRKFLLSHDGDPRHSYKAAVYFNNVAVHMDRRALPPDHKLALRLHPKRDYVPLCCKLQDCVQSPIEMLFGPIKTEFKCLLAMLRGSQQDTSTQVVYESAMQAFRSKGSADRVNRCWRHAAKSILVWTTRCDDSVMIDGTVFQGTNGNLVPKDLAG